VAIERIFDAPRDAVFSAWTDPDQVAQWWGPDGFSTPREKVEIDPRLGGRYHIVMIKRLRSRVPDPLRDRRDRRARAAGVEGRALAGAWIPEATTTRVEFHDEGERTRVNFTSGPFTPDLLEQAKAGWTAQLQNMAQLLEQHST